jgi:hypothetical protein
MLSFTREPGAGDPSANPAKGGVQRQPKGPEDAGSLEYLTVATNTKSVRKSTILVAILVCIGLVCLWFMIRKSQPQAAMARQIDEEETKMEVAITRLTGVSSEMITKMDQILKKFCEFSSVLQVQVGELVKNPFEVEVFTRDIMSGAASPKDEGAQATLIRKQRLKQRASALGLLSVMQSGQASSCMINDQLLQQGDMIEGFAVTRIGGDFVELTWRGDGEPGNGQSAETEDLKVVLKLSQ